MIYRFLLAFGLLSALLLVDVTSFTSATSAHERITTGLSDQCNPHDPKNCL